MYYLYSPILQNVLSLGLCVNTFSILFFTSITYRIHQVRYPRTYIPLVCIVYLAKVLPETR